MWPGFLGIYPSRIQLVYIYRPYNIRLGRIYAVPNFTDALRSFSLLHFVRSRFAFRAATVLSEKKCYSVVRCLRGQTPLVDAGTEVGKYISSRPRAPY